MRSYQGPLRDEPLAIELHNTVYATPRGLVDGLAEPASAAAWLRAVGDRLPADSAGGFPTSDELIALRGVVRDVLHAVIENRKPTRASIDALNRTSALAPCSPAVGWRPRQGLQLVDRFHSPHLADIVLSALAADAIALITGEHRMQLRTCGAPRCVLVFLKNHPRREWCSDSCGNRARQARHYRRVRRRAATS